MKKLIIPILLCLSASACNSESKESYNPPVMAVTNTGHASSWYELPQYYSGVPKYSGAFGTYPNQTMPVAIKSGDDVFQTFSDNLDGNLKIYVMKNTENPVLVHTEYAYIDTHMNAAINVDTDGYVMVHVSGRNYKVAGKVYKSAEPHGTTFNFVKEVDETYPQLHNTAWGYTVLNSKYEYPEGGGVHRTLWIRNDETSYKLVEGGHYQISAYKNGRLYTAFNYHPNGLTDSRANLYVMYTTDGVTWYNVNDELLTLPLPENPENALVYDSEKSGKLVYLKDILVDKFSNVRVLFTESDSANPLIGQRFLREWTKKSLKTFEVVGHNYNSGAYLEKLGKTYFLAGLKGEPYYSGGDLALYQLKLDSWEKLEVLTDLNYSYARPVRNGEGKAVVSVGVSDANLGGVHYNLEIN